MRRRFFVLLLFPLLLLGCSKSGFDVAQARACRVALPALHEDGARIDIMREAPGTAPGSVRIDYRLEETGRPGRVARTTCVFDGSGLQAGRFDLVFIATDGTALSDIKLHILKRWWLEPLGVAAPQAPTTALPNGGLPLPRSGAYLMQQLINGAPVGAVYALLAVAYSLVYGLVGRVVLTFGEIAVFGGYGAYWGASLVLAAMVLSPPLWLLAGLVAGLFWSCLISYVIGHCAVAPLAGRAGQAMIIATLGLAVVVQEGLRLTQGADDKWLPPVDGPVLALAHAPAGFAATATPMQILITAVALTVSLGTAGFMHRSAFGRRWRAVADDTLAASLCGVDSRKVLISTMTLGGILAGVAGWILIVHYGGVGFSNGLAIGLKALAAAVLGGIGSIGGALVGGIIVGMAETLWSGYFPSTWRDVAILGGLVILLAVRPGGLFGFAELGPRRV